MLGLTDSSDGLEGSSDYPEVSSEVQAVVNCAGSIDFSLSTKNPVHMTLFGGTYEDKTDQWLRGSPITYVDDSDKVPILTIHGLDDNVLPIEHAYKLDEAMWSLGTHTLVVKTLSKHTDFKDDVIWWFLDNNL